MNALLPLLTQLLPLLSDQKNLFWLVGIFAVILFVIFYLVIDSTIRKTPMINT